jgi:NOL1/NOP2/sun family putative RNA methylase
MARAQEREKPLELKPLFVKHYQALLGADYDRYVASTKQYLRKAVRLNPLKNDPADTKARLEKFFTLTPIPWCTDAYWIAGERRDIGNTIEHQLGYCYIQEAASMLPPVVLDAQPGQRVLDIAASPGSKTTQLAAMMKNTGIILANDQGIRLRPLGINVQKCGCRNVVVTNMDGRAIKQLQFDRVLADVPCSATGTLQRSAQAAKQWQPRAVEKMAQLQLQLAKNAYAALKPGGRMVYSTCTLEPLENEGVVSSLVSLGARIVPFLLPIKREQPFLEWQGTAFNPAVRHTLRIHPYTNDTEGFFVALLEKPVNE